MARGDDMCESCTDWLFVFCAYLTGLAWPVLFLAVVVAALLVICGLAWLVDKFFGWIPEPTWTIPGWVEAIFMGIFLGMLWLLFTAKALEEGWNVCWWLP